jgi:hypothetical protein
MPYALIVIGLLAGVLAVWLAWGLETGWRVAHQRQRALGPGEDEAAGLRD